MQVVLRRTAPPAPAPYAAAEASFAETKAYLSSREALQMRESDLERELNRRGQELMRKLLQGHLDQRSPGEAAGPVEGADGVERSERRLHDRQLETTFGTVAVERWAVDRRPDHDAVRSMRRTCQQALPLLPRCSCVWPSATATPAWKRPPHGRWPSSATATRSVESILKHRLERDVRRAIRPRRSGRARQHPRRPLLTSDC